LAESDSKNSDLDSDVEVTAALIQASSPASSIIPQADAMGMSTTLFLNHCLILCQLDADNSDCKGTQFHLSHIILDVDDVPELAVGK
jgi:hypothetical protein